MKIIKIKLTVLSVLFTITAFSHTTSATESKIKAVMDLSYFEEYFNSENYAKELDINLVPEIQINVYNETGNLIATGDVKDAKIKSLMNISDLLTEVNGIKYYRLSYQPIN